MYATKVIRNASVIPMTGPTERAQAIAIAGDQILCVGSNADMDAHTGPQTKVIDAQGRTLLPGFIDSHVHFTQTGLGSIGPNVYDVTCLQDILDLISGLVGNASPGDPLLIHGCTFADLDHQLDACKLDELAPANPLMILDIGAHGCAVNSKALPYLGLPSESVAAGILTGKANTLARYAYYQYAISDDDRLNALRCAAAMAVKKGITTVHALDGGSPDGRGWLPERDVEVMLREQHQLDVRTVIYFQSTLEQKALEFGLPRIGGCLWVDGSYGEYTAALLEPYHDKPDCCGSLYFSDEELQDFVGRAHRAGLQISMHAIGDAAIEQLINAYEIALKEEPRADHRHRIEHFSLPTESQIERVAELGITLGMQPNFATMPNEPANGELVGLASVLGEARYNRRHPYRQIIDRGILVAGGSDSEPRPMGPLFGIECLANHPEKARRLSAYEALQLYTVNGARIAFEESTKGTLEPEKLADMVLLSADPTMVDPGKIDQIQIELTIVGGRERFASPAFQQASAQL